MKVPDKDVALLTAARTEIARRQAALEAPTLAHQKAKLDLDEAYLAIQTAQAAYNRTFMGVKERNKLGLADSVQPDGTVVRNGKVTT